jgi:hypothetical protein
MLFREGQTQEFDGSFESLLMLRAALIPLRSLLSFACLLDGLEESFLGGESCRMGLRAI